MTRLSEEALPKARKNDLVMRQIPGELLVYDLKRHKAYCLNETAAAVWKSCDGKRSVSDLAAKIEKDQKSPVDEKIVWLALDQLEKSYLLQTKAAKPIGLPTLSRRSLVRAGIATAIALPLVTMIAAPTAVQAATAVTSATCQGRHNTDPGGCGGAPCTDAAGSCKQNGVSNSCKCQ
jgi:hypothetical protein